MRGGGFYFIPAPNQDKKKEARREAKKILFKNKIEKLIIVDSNFKCKGLITVKDIQKSQIYPEAAKDKKGSLIVAAAVGAGKENIIRAKQLADAGADVIILDTAHGHSISVLKTLESIKKNIKATIQMILKLQLMI